MIETKFSFQYDGKIMHITGAGKHIIDDKLTVIAMRKEYNEFNAAEWVLWFENSGDKDSHVLSAIKDCDISFALKNVQPKAGGDRATEGFPCVTVMNGMVGDHAYHYDDKVSSSEYNLNHVYLQDEETKTFQNGRGRSSDTTVPFFDVHTKESGVIVAVGWSCNWQADFTRNEDNIQIKTGLKNVNFYLKKGEKIRTSSVLVMEYDNEDKYNKFRALMKKHISHKANNPQRRDGILAFELWGSLPSEEMIKRIHELKEHDIKVEDIWIDAGWYGYGEVGKVVYDGRWQTHTGNWNVNPYVHPNKLCDVRDAAKEAGYKLMLWVEPERAFKGAPATIEHPEWFLDNDETYQILNYGNREAFEYIYHTLCEHIETLELSCFRQDFNINPTPFFERNDEVNRTGITEIKHIMGMYELWDRILTKYPYLNIDNCASGGRRFDIETLRRANLFFRSDYQCLFNENPLVLQTHNAGSQCYFPYNGCTSKTKSDTYAIRSSYASNWGTACYNTIFQDMDENDFEWLKQTVDEIRSIRKYFSCDFYNHGSSAFDESSWAIWQYHDKESQSGIVMAFRRCESPFESVNINLEGTLKGRKYVYKNLDSDTVLAGDDSLNLVLPCKRSSTIIEYVLSE